MAEMWLYAVVLGVIPGVIARSKGRDFFPWYVYGVLLFIVALVHSLVLPPTSEATAAREGQQGRRPCPQCAEFIMREAHICRFCGASAAPAANVA